MAEEWLGFVQSYNAQYGVLFVFAALFLENVAFLGVFIPGAVVLLLSAWLAREGPFPALLIGAGFLGTVAGDTVSYLMGKKLGHRLLASKRWGPGISKVSERLRNEPALPLFCHFVAYLRMFVPAAAGMSGVPFGRWLALDSTGASVWVTTHVLLGYFLSVATASDYLKRSAPVVIVVLVLLLGIRYLRRNVRSS